MKHRSRIEITSLILEIANGGGARKTKLTNKANLSHKQLKEHLMFLIDKDLIHYDKEAQTFKTAERGMRFLQMYNGLDDMIKKLSLSLQQKRQKVWI